jgi:rhamnogalacturonan endolyase
MLTVGTYRGNNTTYTYRIPESAFIAGTNTLVLTVVSGSGGTGFLSPGYSYDAVELDD